MNAIEVRLSLAQVQRLREMEQAGFDSQLAPQLEKGWFEQLISFICRLARWQ